MNDIRNRKHTTYAHPRRSKLPLFIILLACVFGAAQVSAVIIDNDQLGTSSTGTWQISGASDPYGSESLWSRSGGTYTWTAASLPAGLYDVQLWWTEWSSRSTSVPVEITHADGTAELTVNQRIDGGQWNTVGQHYFDGAGSVTVFAPGAYPTSYCADAVQFLLVQSGPRPEAVIDSINPNPADSSAIVTFTGHGTDDGSTVDSRWESNIDGILGSSVPANPSLNVALSDGVHTISFFVQDNDGLWSAAAVEILVVGDEPTEFILDNGAPGTSSTGTWQNSGASGYYGDESLWSRNGGTYTWSFTPPVAGKYEVFMWWTEWSSRSTAAPVQITYAGGTTDLTVNQQNDGGLWNSLGTYMFDGSGSVRISAPGSYPTSYCADAVRFTKVSDAFVTAEFEASVTSGDAPLTVNFADLSTSSAAIDTWQWDFDNDGTTDSTEQNPSYEYTTPGTYTVELTVSGTDGSDTEVKTDYIVVTDPSGATELIIDNGEPGTSSTGTWQGSGAAGFYGTESLWSRDGATYTYSFTLSAGTYEVFLWWTEWSSRSTAAPIQIIHAGGTTDTTVNQQTNGGQWNSIGQFYFDGPGSVMVSAPHAYPTSYCADAVRIVTSTGDPEPTASIISIEPTIAGLGEDVTFTGEGYEPIGTIGAYEWTSDLDGFLSDAASFTTDTLSEGTHEIAFRVKNDRDIWSSQKTDTVQIINPSANIERIFCCFGYYTVDQRSQLTNYLNSIGVYQSDDVWHYYTPNKTYIVSYVDTIEGMKTALQTPDSHVLYSGHSNYGLGPLFATPQEIRSQEINNVYYVDDPRILNLSSEWVHISVRGMRTGQAYPFWWPIYQDGTSALAPYTFGNPAGDPAYNYYISYQVPGDPNYYKVDTPRNPPVQRYWDTSVEPWFSVTGQTPDPANPNHRQHFITNYAKYNPSILSTGTWTQSQTGDDYFKENYWYSQSGSGENEVRFLFDVDEPGHYNIFAWWPDDSTGSTAATYTVNYDGGSTDTGVDQSSGSGGWYPLGQYPFNGLNTVYSVSINNDVASGRVFADAIKIGHPDNPPDVVAADFSADPRTGPAPLEVTFGNLSIGDLTGRHWNLGDGFTNSTRDEVSHTYTKPGFYTVTLTASGPAGSDTITKTDYIWVTSSGEVPLQAEFRGYYRTGSPPRTVYFRDYSTGDIQSWFWNFGDGTTSTKQNPTHIYTEFGNYDVSLTITEAGTGTERTVTKENFVSVASYQTVDNVDYPKPHFTGWSGKNIVHIRPQDFDVPIEDIRCKRVFYYSCNSGNYYLDSFKHTGAVVFYTMNLSNMAGGTAFYTYLNGYFNGRSDNQILNTLQVKEDSAGFDYYDFSKRPDEQ